MNHENYSPPNGPFGVVEQPMEFDVLQEPQQSQNFFQPEQYQQPNQPLQHNQFVNGFQNENPPMMEFGFGEFVPGGPVFPNGNGPFFNGHQQQQFHPFQQQQQQQQQAQQWGLLQNVMQENETLRERDHIRDQKWKKLEKENDSLKKDKNKLTEEKEQANKRAADEQRRMEAAFHKQNHHLHQLWRRVQEAEGRFPILHHPPIDGFDCSAQARRFIHDRYGPREPWAFVFDPSKYIFNPNAPALLINPASRNEHPKIRLGQLVDPVPTDRALFKLYSKSGLTWRRISAEEKTLWGMISPQLIDLQRAQERDGLVQVRHRRGKQQDLIFEETIRMVNNEESANVFNPALVKKEPQEDPHEDLPVLESPCS